MQIGRGPKWPHQHFCQKAAARPGLGCVNHLFMQARVLLQSGCQSTLMLVTLMTIHSQEGSLCKGVHPACALLHPHVPHACRSSKTTPCTSQTRANRRQQLTSDLAHGCRQCLAVAVSPAPQLLVRQAGIAQRCSGLRAVGLLGGRCSWHAPVGVGAGVDAGGVVLQGKRQAKSPVRCAPDEV
jgi:hypothetical protein